MDSIHIDTVKLEKANAIRRYRQLHKVTNLFRIIEICVILIVISKFTSRLPVAIKSSSEYFKDLSVFLVSPRFVFIIGNAIVITLFAKSGHSLGQGSGTGSDDGGIEIFDDFEEKSEKIGEEAIENQRKLCEEKTVVVNTYTTPPSTDMKIYRRSKSENLKRERCEKNRRVLQRSVTEDCRKSIGSDEKAAKHSSFAEDDMSNEEFRHAVESFIARQQRFRREEEQYSAFVI